MMTEDQKRRLEKIEETIRKFRIVVVGRSDVAGGFGPLKRGNTYEERLDLVERSIATFRLAGDGLNVSGSYKEGFIVQA